MICPTGKSARNPSTSFRKNQPLQQKYFAFAVGQIISTSSPRPTPTEGRFAIVTDVGLDAVDAGSAADERAYLADGEVVWS